MTDEPTATNTDAVLALAERVRAVLRLIRPDHITPIGVRQIERVLDDAAAPQRVYDDVEVGGVTEKSTVRPLDCDF